MKWDSFMDFLTMGGHGPYVWAAYGLVLAAVVYEIFALRSRRQAICQRLMREARAQRSALEKNP